MGKTERVTRKKGHAGISALIVISLLLRRLEAWAVWYCTPPLFGMISLRTSNFRMVSFSFESAGKLFGPMRYG